MTDPGLRSPLIDLFRRGEIPRDAKLLAAQGALAPRVLEQVGLLMLLSGDDDPEVASAAAATLDRLPREPLAAFLARAEVTSEIRAFFAAVGVEPAASAAIFDSDDPLVDTLTDVPNEGADGSEPRLLSALPIMERMKVAMRGTREQRAQLIRDPNRMIAVAVLSSPKLTEAEVEAFAKMGNVTEEVLRIIASNRAWMKNYGVMHGLCRNPKTPPAISMQLVRRLNEKDLKMLSIDRNVPEALRVLSRKIITKAKYG